MKLRRILLSLLAPAAMLPAAAQTDALLTHYRAVATYYNPAAAGSCEWLRINAVGRLQWVGIEHAPKSFVITADSPLPVASGKLGAGITLQRETLGLFTNLSVNAQVAYRLRIGRGMLGAGFSLGYFNQQFKGSEAVLPDDGGGDGEDDGGDSGSGAGDSTFPQQDVAGGAVDLGAGVWYDTGSFYAGVACMHLLQPDVRLAVKGSGNSAVSLYESQIGRMAYFTAGGNIRLGKSLFKMQPSMLVQTDFSNFSAAATLHASYNDFLSAGVGYRWKDAVSLMLGAEYKGFYLGYSYDIPLSAIARASSGSHEIALGYRLRLDFSKKNKNKQRSIRIM